NTETKPATGETTTEVPVQVATLTQVSDDHPNGSTYGDFVTFHVTVSSTSAGVPGGTAQFVLDGVNWGTPVTLVNGTAASPSIGGLGAGAHTVSAIYSGDVAFLGGTSVGDTLDVARASLTVAVDSQTRMYGQGNPNLSYQLMGLVNGD